MKEIRMSDISILSAHDVDSNLLLDFYNIVYPSRMTSLPRIWKWLNRSSFCDNKIPLVILYKDRIIAHAGVIPFKFLLDAECYTGCWFIDFAVLPEFQRRGLGSLLLRKRMEFTEAYFGFPNDQAWGLERRIGVFETFNTNLHYYLLLPFNHPRFADSIPRVFRTVLNVLSCPFLGFNYHRYASSIGSLRFDNIDPYLLDNFVSSYKMQDGTVEPVRDSEYVSWRLLNSPNKMKYRIVRIDGVDDVSIIIKLYDNRQNTYIDVLWLSNPFKYADIRRLIATLAVWGFHRDYSYIRHYVSSKELSTYLSKSLKSIVRHPRFLFFSKNPELFRRLKDSKWHWELIDSDFEEY